MEGTLNPLKSEGSPPILLDHWLANQPVRNSPSPNKKRIFYSYSIIKEFSMENGGSDPLTSQSRPPLDMLLLPNSPGQAAFTPARCVFSTSPCVRSPVSLSLPLYLVRGDDRATAAATAASPLCAQCFARPFAGDGHSPPGTRPAPSLLCFSCCANPSTQTLT